MSENSGFENDGRLRILLVGPAPEERRALAGSNFAVTPAPTREQALALLSGEEFSAVLVDLDDPTEDGLETARLIREAVDRHIPLLGLTGVDMPDRIGEFFAAGLSDFLSRPVDAQLLEQAISQALDEEDMGEPVRRTDTAAPVSFNEAALRQFFGFLNADRATAMIGEFIAEAREKLERIPELKDERESAVHELHMLASVAGNIGFETLAAHSRSLMKVADLLDEREFLAVMKALKKEFEDNLPALTEAIQRNRA